jgi:hypothetical protein
MTLSRYLVFLDIDGVFTSPRVNYAHNAVYNMWHRFDPVVIDFMNKLHDSHPLEFVVMSTWKDGLNPNNDMIEHWVRAAFGNSGFRGEFAKPWKTDPDSLIKTRLNNNDRAFEVLDYLENFGSSVVDYLLFDDNKYMFNEVLPKKRLILTDPENGLLHKHMLHATSITGTWEKK